MGPEICDDLIDNDVDFAADCYDTDCVSETVCDDRIDNDGDWDTDCDDGDCMDDPACAGLCPDSGLEPDELPLTLGGLDLGETEVRAICPEGDLDAWTFELTEPTPITIATEGPAGQIFDQVRIRGTARVWAV